MNICTEDHNIFCFHCIRVPGTQATRDCLLPVFQNLLTDEHCCTNILPIHHLPVSGLLPNAAFACKKESAMLHINHVKLFQDLLKFHLNQEQQIDNCFL